MYKSLREFIELLDREGELLRVKCEVTTDEEICEITDRISKCEGGGKAILFEHNGTNFPVATNMMGSERRMELALGDRLDELTPRIDALLREATSPKNSIWDKLRTLPILMDVAKWLPTTSSSKGRCQEVIVRGDDIKLSELPILKCWGYDGGRFVTLPMVNTIDPDTGQRNVGMYRMQVLDETTTAMHWHIHKTGARHFEAYRRRGEKMPVSVALGGDPTYTYAATAPMPDNMDEYLLAGFLRRRKVSLVKCITNDIYVPDDCDFVLEGYVDPSEAPIIEGPFGDHTGFYSLQDYYPKFHITAITHRRNAIYPATIVGVPPQEDAYIAMATERIFLSPIRFALQPEVRDMTMPPAGTAHNVAVISIEKRYRGQAQKVIQSLWGAGQMMFNKYLLIAPHDVDIRNHTEIADLLRRVDLRHAVVRSEGVYDILDHATATNGYGGKLAIDLTSVAERERPVEEFFCSVDRKVSVRKDMIEKWSLVALFVGLDYEMESMQIAGVNYVVLFDAMAESMNEYELLWLAAANTEPNRDITVTPHGMMIIDARSKRPGVEDNPSRFPNVVTSLPATIELVDRRWEEYGIGEFIPSPSRHYRKLLLSNKECW